MSVKTISPRDLNNFREAVKELSDEIKKTAQDLRPKNGLKANYTKTHETVLDVHHDVSYLVHQLSKAGIVNEEDMLARIGWIGEKGEIELSKRPLYRWSDEASFYVRRNGEQTYREWETPSLMDHFQQTLGHLTKRINNTFKVAARPELKDQPKYKHPYGKESGWKPAVLEINLSII